MKFVDCVPFEFSFTPGRSVSQQLHELEYEILRVGLIVTQGNKNQLAKWIGLNRKTLVNKLKKHQLFIHGSIQKPLVVPRQSMV